ncbi:hypothetical protein EPO33_02230 [Patescibacteria group bacterium]|nr:MAG: hypothetical protein EPO33_02230 [Patescibacteria group bacterium]
MLGKTLEVLGELCIGYLATRVHGRVMKERRIDDVVLKEMRREKHIGTVGITLIVVGFVLELTMRI